MNKMAEVAKLFNKELEEKFTIIDDNDVVICDACFNEAGLACFLPGGKAFLVSVNILKKLLTGTYRIKETPWKAELNEEYYIPMPSNPGRYLLMTNDGSKQDDKWHNDGLMCKTKEQAIEIAKAMIKVAHEMQGFYDGELM